MSDYKGYGWVDGIVVQANGGWLFKRDIDAKLS